MKIKEVKEYITDEIIKWEEVKSQCLDDLHHCSSDDVALTLLKASCHLDVLRELENKLKT